MKKKSLDRRIGKTRLALQQALIALMREQPYDSILVEEILERANTGRSTFYSHFHDKDDLLISGLENLRAEIETRSQADSARGALLSFSLPMFEHAFAHRQLYRSLINSRAWGRVRAEIENILRSIAGAELKRRLVNRTSALSPEIILEYLIVVYVALITLWLEKRTGISAAEADDTYRQLVMPALRSQIGD